MSKRVRSEVKERWWREHVTAWQRSELSIRQYCLQQQLSEPNFYAWRRELARRAEMSSTTTKPVDITRYSGIKRG